MQAQEQIRIWKGGNTSSSRFTTSELLFSEDGTNLSVNGTTFQTSELDSIMVVHTVTVTYNGADYDFCVERYLTGPDTDVYKAFAEIKAGDVVDIEGFVYWYNGINTHITKVTVK